MSQIWQTVYPIIIAVLFFQLIIVIHEGGHFVAARLMKIKVNEFSIGMGPKLIQFTKGETKYTLRLVLFGGYCAMEGEDSDSDDENAFSNKRVIQRIFVVVAGAFMNLVLGLVIISIMVSTQSLIGTTTVAKFEDNAISSQTLEVGDKIKSIDGMRVYTSTDVTTGLSRSADNTVEFVVERNGKAKKLDVEFEMTEYEGHQYINMDFFVLGVEKTFFSVIKESLAQFVSYCRMIFLSLHDLIVGRYGVSDISGPVGTVSIVSTAVKTSLPTVLRIMALLTVNVGLFNLFPFPALDGWRLFVLVFEGIFKKKLPSKFEWLINSIGLALLIGLMCVVTFSDITKLF